MRGVMLRVLALATALVCVQTVAARAGILVDVDLARQQMTVDVDGKRLHTWPVSTARSGYATPTGAYTPFRMHKIWYSRKYDDAPMPNAIFYSGGYAIHGTGSVGMLGRPASHGCVRLAPGNAAQLYAMVQQKGLAATRIVIRGTPPRSAPAAVAQGKQPGIPPVALATYQPQQGLLADLFGWSQPAGVPAPRGKSRLGAQVRPPIR